MAQSRRILFVAGEVTPFAETSSIASLARMLPEQLQDAGDFEARVMMPCYGTIDERKHNLHEVIRLSGTDVPMGSETETLTVKVASVPDVRLQVYFMDHETYFGKEQLAADGGDVSSFEDVCRRALFFNRAALETIRKLRWGPSVIHSFGWMSGFVPHLLSTEYNTDDRLSDAKAVFTPDDQDPGTHISTDLAGVLGLALDGQAGSTISETGLHYADASIHPPGASVVDGTVQFEADTDAHGRQLSALYDQMLDEVPA
jgi:starch synthase